MLVDGKLFWLDGPGNVFLIRYENLQNDWDRLLISVGMEPVKLPHLNRTGGKGDYRDYYDPSTVAMVADKFAEEISKFGYTF